MKKLLFLFALGLLALVPFKASAYEVVKGDNLWELSQACGISVNEMATFNKIPNPNLIKVGQEIKCPLKTESRMYIPEMYPDSLGATIISNKSDSVNSALTFPLLSETPTELPPTGYYKLYYKDDGFLYQLNSAGNETVAGGGGGGGDMYKSVYDTDADDIVDNSEQLGGQLPAYYAASTTVVHNTGDETIAGRKTFSSFPLLPSGTPDSENAAVTRAYTTSIAAGLLPKDPVNAGTTGNITLSGEQTIDGVSVTGGMAVLVKDQTDATENGIYTASTSAWSRRTDFDETSEVKTGSFTFILAGTANSNKQYAVITTGTIIPGTSGMQFAQINTTVAYTAGDGIDISGNSISVGTGEVTSSMLAGSIADSKLSTITTADKVAWDAVNKTGSTLDSIADVNTTDVAEGSCLVYDSGTTSWVDSVCTSNDGTGAVTSTYNLFFGNGSSITWTNMPAAVNPFAGSVGYYKKSDLSAVSQYRIVVGYRAGTVAAGADLNLQYYNGSAWVAADTGAAGELSIAGSAGQKVGAWADLAAGAKGDVMLRIVGKDGDAVQDPTFWGLYVEFKQLIGGGGSASTPYYGDFYVASSTNLFAYSGAGGTYQAIGASTGGFTTGTLATGITFHPGKAGPITNFADQGGGTVRAETISAHELVAGDVISIDQGTDYDGMRLITNVSDSTHFDFSATYVGATGGGYTKAAYLNVGPGAEGVYDVRYHGDVLGASANDTLRFALHKNATVLNNTLDDLFITSTTTPYSIDGGGLVTLTTNDKIVLGVNNLTSDNGFTLRNLNVTISKK